jgi:hypothetical protein
MVYTDPMSDTAIKWTLDADDVAANAGDATHVNARLFTYDAPPDVRLDPPTFDPGHGALYVPAVLCIDAVYVYDELDPITGERIRVREWNSPAAVADMTALAGRAPVTLLHPRDAVTPDSADRLVVGDADGTAFPVEFDAETGPDGTAYKRVGSAVLVAVRRRRAMDALGGWEVPGLSPGFNPIREDRSGIHPLDGPYDRVRVGVSALNHIALVPNPRGGDLCRVLDAADADALDASDGIGYAVAKGLKSLTSNVSRGGRTVKPSTEKDSIMTREEFVALLSEVFKTAQADAGGVLMRDLIAALTYSDAYKATMVQTAGRVLMSAVSGVASTDAEGDLPSDPAALRAAILAMVQGEIQKAMMVKRPGEGEGAEIEVSLGDAYGALMTDMGQMKTDMAGCVSKMDAMGANLENKVATAATDAKRALDASTGANALAKSAKDAADAVTEADRKRIEKDAADGAATRLAAARNLATEFGMTKDAAAGSELSDLVKHLRLKRVGGCTENDSDDAVIASARTALSMRGKSLPMATDAASTIKATIDPTAYFG